MLLTYKTDEATGKLRSQFSNANAMGKTETHLCVYTRVNKRGNDIL